MLVFVTMMQFIGDKQEVRSPESSYPHPLEMNQNGYCLLIPFSLKNLSVPSNKVLWKNIERFSLLK